MSTSIDIICLQTWKRREELHSPLKKELNRFLTKIKETLTERNKLSNKISSLYNTIFHFRLKGLKWLIQNGDFEIDELLEKIYPEIEKYKSVDKFSLLVENILFALRSNSRVVKNLIDSGAMNEPDMENSVQRIKNLTYEQFIASLEIAIPDKDATQTIINWSNASLTIEFGAIAGMLIFRGELITPQKRINELSELISEAAQEYTACALQMGLLNIPGQFYQEQDEIPSSVVKEEKILSDWGFNEYVTNVRRE